MPNRHSTSLCRRVEARRHKLGLNQTEAAAALKVTQGHYSKMVSGHVSVGPKSAQSMATWLEETIPMTRNVHPKEVTEARLVSQFRRLRSLLDVILDGEDNASPHF